MASECRPPRSVILECESDARCWFREDLIEQVQVVWMDVVPKVAALIPQPGPSDDTTALDPHADPPLVLATFVLAQIPRDVADVPGRAQPEQPSLLDGELLHG